MTKMSFNLVMASRGVKFSFRSLEMCACDLIDNNHVPAR
jgi:hypothetical protein